MSVSRRIREERKRLGLTQGELAEQLGVSQGTISRWESGAQSPDFTSLLKLGELTPIDVVKLSFGSDEEHPYTSYPTWGEVPVVGAVQVGKWVENEEWEKDDHFSVNVPPQLRNIEPEIKGFLVRDGSAEPFLPENSIAFVTKIDFRNFVMKSNDVLLVKDCDENELCEITLKKVTELKDGEFILENIANQLIFEAAYEFVIGSDGRASGVHQSLMAVEVLGLVVSSFRLEPALARLPN